MPSEWMKPSELAAREGCSRQTVWRWVARGIAEVQRAGAKRGVRVRLRGGRDTEALPRYRQDEYGQVFPVE